MLTEKIGNMKVKDIFEHLLGEKNAANILEKIQKEYDKGVAVEDLEKFAIHSINEIPDLQSDSTKICSAIIAVLIIPKYPER